MNNSSSNNSSDGNFVSDWPFQFNLVGALLLTIITYLIACSCRKYSINEEKNFFFVLKFCAILFYLLDLLSDWTMANFYLVQGRKLDFYLTLLFNLVPLVPIALATVFVFTDLFKERDGFCTFFLLFLLSLLSAAALPVVVLATILALGTGEIGVLLGGLRRSLVKLSALYSLIDAIFESAPQIILQTYIHINTVENEATLTKDFRYLSIAFSLVGFSKSIYDFKQHFERTDMEDLSGKKKVFYFVKNIFVIGPRVILLALFCSVFKLYSFIFVAFRILLAVCFECFIGHHYAAKGRTIRRHDKFLLGIGSIANIYFFYKYMLSEYEGTEANENDDELSMQKECAKVYFIVFYCENLALLLLYAISTRYKDVWYFYFCIVFTVFGFLFHMFYMANVLCFNDNRNKSTEKKLLVS